jgi:predicted metal-dependent enzyme (double-stranded beta helix superfamily)
MDTRAYSIPQLVEDLRQIRTKAKDEREILNQVRPLARRAALAKDAWLKPEMLDADEQQGFGVHLLHEEPDHTLAVFAVSWLPGRGTPPHDHGTWAVVAGAHGPELNRFFERVDDRSRKGHAELKQVGAKTFGVGDVVAMPAGAIHVVWNESDAVSVSLHIYGKHINHTQRSQYDTQNQTETPFVVKVS